MRILLLLILSLGLLSCEDTTSASSPKLPADFKKDTLTWEQYHLYCGNANALADENFKELYHTSVLWEGTYVGTISDTERQNFCTEVIRIKMAPSHSTLADLQLRIPKKMEAQMQALKKGDYILFQAKIAYIGGSLLDHILEAENFKVIPKSAPKTVVR